MGQNNCEILCCPPNVIIRDRKSESSNLCLEDGYLDSILRLSVGPPNKFRISLLGQGVTAFFQVLSNTIFTNYPPSFCSWES